MNDPIEMTNTIVETSRSSLIAGGTSLPVELGLQSRALHVERGERECLSAALPALATFVGPAARVIECGVFAGQVMPQILNALERPKAGVVMTSNLDQRQFGRLTETITTAQVTHINHDAASPFWPLEAIGAGNTLLICGGGGFGLTPAPQAFAMLDNASQTLAQGDYVAITLEMARDGAVLEAVYRDFGEQIATHALTGLGRIEGLEPRTFYDAARHTVRFGALAHGGASLSWNGTRCDFDEGTWLDLGAMRLHTQATLVDLHPDFQIQDQWQSQDTVVTLLLLRKI